MTYRTTKKCCYLGYVIQAIAINFLPLLFVMLQNIYKLSYTLIGTLIAVAFLTQLCVDILSVFFLDKIGYRISAVASQFFCAAGFVMLTILPDIMPPYAGLCISVILYSIGAGLIEVVINPIIAGIPKEYGQNFVFTHSFYSWGQLSVVLFTTIALKLFGEASWKLIAVFWAVIPLLNGLLFVKTPILPAQKDEHRSVSALFRNKTFIAILILMICAGGSELAMAQWASAFAQQALKVDKTLGDLLGPCLFAFFMGIGRLMYSLMENKLNFRKFSIFSCILCFMCYAATAVSKNPIISLAGCSFCGFAISALWPGIVELASKRIPDGGGAMYSAIAIFGDIGCSVAPFLTGLVASELSLRSGMLINIIYPIVFILIIRKLIKK